MPVWVRLESPSLRDAEVEDLDAAVAREQQVVRLDVAVDDPLACAACSPCAICERQRLDLLDRSAARDGAVRLSVSPSTSSMAMKERESASPTS